LFFKQVVNFSKNKFYKQPALYIHHLKSVVFNKHDMKGFHFKNGTFDPTMARSVHFFELAYAQTAKKCPLGHSARQVGCPKISVKFVQALHINYLFKIYTRTLIINIRMSIA